jgi:hypothetical protein
MSVLPQPNSICILICAYRDKYQLFHTALGLHYYSGIIGEMQTPHTDLGPEREAFQQP